MEIGNQMQNHKIETNSELIYEDGNIWLTLIFIKIIGSNTLWFPLPPPEVLWNSNLTHCDHVIKYCTTVYERNGKNLFWSIKNSGEILNKLKSIGFLASGLSTYDFSALYTTLPHNLIKEKLTELIEQTFNREGSLYLACNDKNAFFTSEQPKRYKLWSCQKMCDALHYLLDNIFIRFGSKLYRQIVGIPMGTNCAPLVADLFLFCYDRDFMLSLSDNNQADIIEAFNSTSRYLDDLLNIDNPYFEQMVGQIYPTELQLNKANSSDTEAPFLDLNLLLTFCLLLLPLWESVIVLCIVVRYLMSILVLQSSWWGRESWLICLICLPGVSWWLGGSSSRCHGVVCSLWLWYFLIILTYYFFLSRYHFNINSVHICLKYVEQIMKIKDSKIFLLTCC